MASAPAAPGPWRLIGVVLLWLLLVEVGGGEAGLLGAYFVTGLLHGGTPAQGVAAPGQPGFVVTALSIAFCTQLIMLLAARRQGRRLGRHVPAGLGGGPIRRRRVVAALFALQLASTVGVVFLVHRVPEIRAAAQTLVPFVTETTSVALAPVLAGVFLILLLAPLAEELFFRGWLRTGLRQSWGPVGTGLLTGGAWLSLHLGNGLWKPLFILPSAILFSLARHYGGSVRASLWLHVATNTLALLLPAIELWRD